MEAKKLAIASVVCAIVSAAGVDAIEGGGVAFIANARSRYASINIKTNPASLARRLINACKTNDFDSAKRILSNDPTIIDKISSGGYTALSIASINNYEGIVRFLVNEGADIRKEDRHGYTPIASAAASGKFEVLNFFLYEQMLNIDMVGLRGLTALMSASIAGQKEIVGFLVDHGAYIGAKNDRGLTAAMLAARYCHEEILQFLNEYQLDEE